MFCILYGVGGTNVERVKSALVNALAVLTETHERLAGAVVMLGADQSSPELPMPR